MTLWHALLPLILIVPSTLIAVAWWDWRWDRQRNAEWCRE